MKIQFNTGRGYTAHGQRIIALVEKDQSRIRFKDIDRGVCGAIPIQPHLRTDDAYTLQQIVMANYDAGNYSPACCGDLFWITPEIQFFLDHASHNIETGDLGRYLSAATLAEAEEWALKEGVQFHWNMKAPPYWECTASLRGHSISTTDTRRLSRVVEAELANQLRSEV